jgi:hypothetical protein
MGWRAVYGRFCGVLGPITAWIGDRLRQVLICAIRCRADV